MERNPFSSLKIDSTEFLEAVEDREQCPQCKRSRKYFCYTCFVVMPSLVGKVPVMKLPYKIDIIKHRQEVNGKSTAIHAKLLAPEDTRIFVYPDIPEYDVNQKVVLVCPGANSVTLAEYMKQQSQTLNGKEVIIETESAKSFDDSELIKSSDSVIALKGSENFETVHPYNSIINAASGPSKSDQLCNVETESSKSFDSDECTQSDKLHNLDARLPVRMNVSKKASRESNKSSDPSSSVVADVSIGSDQLCNVDAGQTGEMNERESRPGPDVVVYIDSTWNQVYGMLGHPKLAGLQRIELQTYETRFWRHQMDKPSTYLSTIEAIYYTACEYYELSSSLKNLGGAGGQAYDGCYDNLLFFFTFYYNKIARECARNGRTLKAYHTQRRKVPRRLQR